MQFDFDLKDTNSSLYLIIVTKLIMKITKHMYNITKMFY